jgi:hypothetical protein
MILCYLHCVKYITQVLLDMYSRQSKRHRFWVHEAFHQWHHQAHAFMSELTRDPGWLTSFMGDKAPLAQTVHLLQTAAPLLREAQARIRQLTVNLYYITASDDYEQSNASICAALSDTLQRCDAVIENECVRQREAPVFTGKFSEYYVFDPENPTPADAGWTEADEYLGDDDVQYMYICILIFSSNDH